MSNLISAAFTAAQKTAINGAVVAISTNIPSTASISKSQKKASQKLGSGGQDYVAKASSYGSTYVNVMPRSFDPAEMLKDKALYADLMEMEAKVGDIYARLQMLRTMAGIDMISEANKVKTALNAAAKEDVSFKAASDDLNEFYKKRNQKDKTPPPAPGQ